MSEPVDFSSITDPAVVEQQLYIYAQELSELYEREREERQALAEEKLVLEYRLKELSALNNLFQRHLEARLQLEELLQRVARALQEQVAQASRGPRRDRLQRLLSDVEQALAQAESLGPLQERDSSPGQA